MSHRAACGLFIASLCLTASATADPSRALSEADYARAERLLPYNTAPLLLHTADNVTWLADGRFCYVTTTPDGRHFLSVDPKRGTRAPLFDEARLAAALSASSGSHYDGFQLPFRSVELSADGARISFEAASLSWSCDVGGAHCARSAARNPDESLSPDRKRAVFIRDYNLWVRDVASGEEKPLTSDGVKDFGYATDNPGWEHTNHAILTWSPDSRKIATYQQDQRGVGEMVLISTRLGHPRVESWKYPMAGDAAVAAIRRVIIDVDSGKLVPLGMPPDPHRSSPCYDVQCGDETLADVQWSADGSHLAFVSSSRDHKRAQLREADAATGAVRTILEERVPTFYESDISATSQHAANWRYLPKSGEVIWLSERDNWAHLYLYDLNTGKLKHRLTSGAWDVVELLAVDEKHRVLYLTGVGREVGRDPYFVHLYKVGLDGKDPVLLTPENAHHEISMAPSGEYFVDRYSRPEVPPVMVLREANGKLMRTLETADISRLLSAGWTPPVPFTVKARDGMTDLYGLMFKPSSFDAGRKYPIVDWVYPGPHIGSVGSRHFAASHGDRQALAELGFIVIALDGMGTPFRSKSFHDVVYGNLRDNTLPDQVAGMRQLAQRYPWIDLERAGIYGHSGGGYAAATAMFLYPDFFKVGIAESGNHDPRGYTDDWAEKFMGLPERKADGGSTYDAQDTESLVRNLKGHLLLMHGTLDDNVPPYLTLLLVDSLIKANKDFDLLMLPNQHHMYEGEADSYATRRRWDYFVRHLLGAEPPHEYPMHRPADAAADPSSD
jgi:dipeptidyl aminopeptidase/acylaminoacyl peptidase